MLTRGRVQRNYLASSPPPVNIPGYMRQETVKNIPQTWVIARPNSSPAVPGSPMYLSGLGTQAPAPTFMFGGAMPLTPAKPNVEMDPSDPSTWQRKYKFT